jgi:hypothetical protein
MNLGIPRGGSITLYREVTLRAQSFKGKGLIMKTVIRLFCVVCVIAGSSAVWAMGTEFTYQGRLHVGGDAAEGPYDVRFELFDAATAGNPVGLTLEADDLDIVGGYFTLALDFGADVFDGNNRWLQISVRPATSTDPAAYVPLLPRQAITPAPYAMYAKSGTPGPQGPIGPVGPKGDKGDTGAVGARGLQGIQGIQGVQGPTGAKGDKGDTGTTGPQGIQGPQGLKGDKGDPGATGAQGPTGPTLGIYDSLGLASSGGRAAGDAGGRNLTNLGNVQVGGNLTSSGLTSNGICSVQSKTDIHFTIDSGDNSDLFGYFELFNGKGQNIWGVMENGDMYVTGRASIGNNLSIGNIAPTEALDVGIGNIRVRGTGGFDAPDESAYLYLGDVNHYIKSTYGFGLNLGTWNVPDIVTIREGTGNVGIATTNPTERLDVNGTVRAERVAYSTPRTHYFSVGSEAFVPGSNAAYTNSYGMGGAYLESGAGALVAAVHLPHGAIVTGFKAYFYDNSAADIDATLYGQSMNGAYASMASVSSVGISGYGSATTTTINHSTIDNAQYGYCVYAYCSGWTGSSLRIKGAVITYTISEAD